MTMEHPEHDRVHRVTDAFRDEQREIAAEMTALDWARYHVEHRDTIAACERYEDAIAEKIDIITRQMDTIDQLRKVIKISMDNFNTLAGIVK